MDNTNPQMPSSTQLSRKASPAVIILSILTLAGIGFGVFGMIKANQSANIEDFKIQISDNAGNITEIDANQVTQSGDQGTITITESNSIESFIKEINDKEAENNLYVLSYDLHTSTSTDSNSHHEILMTVLQPINEPVGGFVRLYYKIGTTDDWHFLSEGQESASCKDLPRDGQIAMAITNYQNVCFIKKDNMVFTVNISYNPETDQIRYFDENSGKEIEL